MSDIGDGESRAIKPDAQGFDEVRIVTMPRYKESELSGDEWRISASMLFYRKGRLVHEAHHIAHDVERACAFAAYYHAKACDDGNAYFAGEGDLCDQEGCAEQATVTYRLKKGYERSGVERPLHHGGEIRRFCQKHTTRGDCGLEDADHNYVRV